MMLLPNNWRTWWTRTLRHGDNGHCVSEPLKSDAYQRLRIPRRLCYPKTTLGQILDQTAARFPETSAVGYHDLDWTYHELHKQVNRLAGGLAKSGVIRGDRVMMTLPNCPEFIVAFFAIQKLGAIVVNAGPLMGADDLYKVIEMTDPRLIIGLDLQATTLVEAANGLGNRTWLWVSLKEYLPVLMRMGYRVKKWKARADLMDSSCEFTWQDLLAQSPARPPSVAPDIDDIALLQPTGGTTGTLKIAQLSHRNLLSNAAQLSLWVKLQPGQECILGILPMFHVYGLMLGLITAVYAGSRMLPVTRFKVQQLMDIICTNRPTMIPLVPAIFDALNDQLEREPNWELTELFRNGIVMSGAAPLDESIAERFTHLTGSSIVQGYGLTEASPVTHVNPYDASRPKSIGITLPDTRMRLVDLYDPTQDVNEGQPGELLISGPQVFCSYLHNPDETENVLIVDEQGHVWLRTGDVAQIDDDGFVYIIDRKKHMINHAGLKVYPRKVERVLKAHPAVTDAAVVGRPNSKTTEDVVAYVVVSEPSRWTDEMAQELRTLCRKRLAPYEVPSTVEFVAELPRSALGKLLKHRLGTDDDTQVQTASVLAARNGDKQEIH